VPHRVAVVGAGFAGLACARVLRRAGCYVDLFEASGGVGGRMATTRLGLTPFDHGAQYVTARSETFTAYLEEIAAAGYARVWDPKIAIAGEEAGNSLQSWYVGMPGMSAMVRPLAESVQVFTDRRVHTIDRKGHGWRVWFDDQTSEGVYAGVAIAVPAPQAALILGPMDDMAHQTSRVRMAPCWALMVQLEEETLPQFDVYSDMSQIIRWIGRNNSKPGRNLRGENVVVHASQSFSRETDDADPELVAEELWNEVCHLLGLPPNRPKKMHAHLWNHALVEQPLGETYLYSDEHCVGVAGDWCSGRLAEHAFVSGSRLGRAMVGTLK